ncbi:unnamed protein product [Prorocentrum cordatum]|uniref:Uncharacterized protein n=1 Tax=Prorocentrum cordatum TaxID=2364126 RepID=A0ABN9VAD4_9DINO|nr:unnamed protein product [Polarella glacialis]
MSLPGKINEAKLEPDVLNSHERPQIMRAGGSAVAGHAVESEEVMSEMEVISYPGGLAACGKVSDYELRALPVPATVRRPGSGQRRERRFRTTLPRPLDKSPAEAFGASWILGSWAPIQAGELEGT